MQITLFFCIFSGNDNNDTNNHFNNEEVLFPNSTENGKPNSSSVNNKENAQPIIETTIKKPRGSLLDVSFFFVLCQFLLKNIFFK